MRPERLIRVDIKRLILTALLALSVAGSGYAGEAVKTDLPPLPAVFQKSAPSSIEDLKAIEQRTQQVVKKVMSAIVNVRIGAGQGSGVIISEDGYIMTAGHVSGEAGRPVVITLPDGKQVKGKTLGANHIVDSGLVKITDKGTWPFIEFGDSAALKKGDWCVAIGHPGGIQKGRSPVVRLGRILDNGVTTIRTDCTLVGGDSGGPLFDMNGKVIAIHSRIGEKTWLNFHVPAKQYKDDWTRLVKSDIIYPGYLGVKRDPNVGTCKILEVVPESAAAKAGIQPNDVILKINDKKIASFDDLAGLLNGKRSGDEVMIEVQRGEQTMLLNVVLGALKK